MRRRADKNVGLAPRAVRALAAQLASALAHIHGARVVHRDVKMENVLFVDDAPPPGVTVPRANPAVALMRAGVARREGDGGGGGGSNAPPAPLLGCAKLVDFGFSMTVTENDRSCSDCCGTHAYIAPEVFDPNKPGYGRPADVWSLGVLLFATLTGNFPFTQQAATRHEAHKTLTKSAVPPYVDKLAPGALALLLRLLEPAVEKRVSAEGALADAWVAAGADDADGDKCTQQI